MCAYRTFLFYFRMLFAFSFKNQNIYLKKLLDGQFFTVDKNTLFLTVSVRFKPINFLNYFTFVVLTRTSCQSLIH